MLLKITAGILIIYASIITVINTLIIIVNLFDSVSRTMDELHYGSAYGIYLKRIKEAVFFYVVPGLILVHFSGVF